MICGNNSKHEFIGVGSLNQVVLVCCSTSTKPEYTLDE